MTPALPPQTGESQPKARFFAEAAAAFELLALYHQLTPEEQKDFHDYVHTLSAAVYERKRVRK